MNFLKFFLRFWTLVQIKPDSKNPIKDEVAEQLVVISVGGWNNGLYNKAETFNIKEKTWNNASSTIPLSLRSSALIELNHNPYLIGGVTCQKQMSKDQVSSRL